MRLKYKPFNTHRTNHALRVVRSMRVARLLKLFKHSQGLQDIGVVLLASAPSFSAISILVLLFWVVFGIVGMNVFGGIGMDQAYPNFDTFISSILISFQVRVVFCRCLLTTGTTRVSEMQARSHCDWERCHHTLDREG